MRTDKRFSCFPKRHVGVRRYIEQLSALLFAPCKDGIDQVPHHIAIPGGEFSRLAQRNTRERTKPHLPYTAVQFEPEHP